MSEAAVQTAIRIRAGELGIKLWRNNTGACEDATGRLIRYGLANDSAQMSKRIKSSDLIGWVSFNMTAVVAHAAMSEKLKGLVRGHRHTQPTDVIRAVFLSVECKRADWHADPSRYNDREKAQAAWHALVIEDGGIAGFCRSVEEFERLIGHGR